MHRGLALAILFLSCVPAFGATANGPIPVPLPLFPPNNWWNADISAAPVDSNSSGYISYVGTATHLHPDWGPDNGDGTLYGFPYILADGSQPKLTVNFVEIAESDGVGVPFYPIPPEAITNYGWIEEGPPGNVDDRAVSDRHMLIVDTTNNDLYELYNVWYDGTTWQAYSGAFWHMNTNDRRPDGWTSADAAGLQILPGLVRYDEVYGPNEITHAFRCTVQHTNSYVFPASHLAGTQISGALPMGARLRLKANKDISAYPADVQKIFRAFKKYGLIVADNGSNIYVSGAYNPNWNMSPIVPAFLSLTANDFEVVQLGWKPPVSLVISCPATVPTGSAQNVMVTAYDSNFNPDTSYTGTLHFSSTDGAATLPANYTFTAGDGGTHMFTGGLTMNTAGGQTVYATDVSNAMITGSRNLVAADGPATPTGVVAVATTTTSVNISWPASAGASQYEIDRQSESSPYASLTTTAATSFSDTTVTAGHSYVYKVRAIDSLARTSGFSVPDAATTIFFTDDPLAGGTTAIKAAHVDELRQAVNAMRAAALLAAASFTDPTLGSNVAVKALHIQQLRTALDEARSTLAIPALAYTDATLVSGTTPIKAAHVQELRDGVK